MLPVFLTSPVTVDNASYPALVTVVFDRATALDIIAAGLGVWDNSTVQAIGGALPHFDHFAILRSRLVSGRVTDNPAPPTFTPSLDHSDARNSQYL